MEPMENAVVEVEGGCILHVQVVSASKAREFFQGYDGWRRSLVFCVTEEPREGRANSELLGKLADLLGVSRQTLEIVSGARAHRKRIIVRGLGKAEILSVLQDSQRR